MIPRPVSKEEKDLLTRTDYIDANIKAILRGHILAPILNAQQLRDEAFGKFWVAFSCTSLLSSLSLSLFLTLPSTGKERIPKLIRTNRYP